MKVQVTSRKLIKPCKPTPSKLRSFKISYLDEIAHPVNLSVTLYYTSGMVKERFNRLEKSLSEILPLFYPLAGRYMRETHMVDCNDEGAEYVQAQVDCNLLELINDPDLKPNHLNDLLPCDICVVDQVTNPLLAIQVSKFKCGGMAICVSISHRIFDAASVDIFIAAWTSATRGQEDTMAISPSFNAPLVFPSKNTDPENGETDRTIVAKRFLFDKSAMSSLRAKAMDTKELGKRRPPSRSRLVSVLVMKVLARIDQKKYKKSRPLLIVQAVSIRERTVPPLLTKHSCGNLVVLSLTETTTEQCENMESHALIRFLGDSITKTLASYTQILSDPTKDSGALMEDARQSITRSYMNGAKVLWFSDFTKFSFYEADFGWGKPIWASVPNTFTKDFVLLMDNKVRDVIEVWVHLDAQDMVYFQEDEEIKHKSHELRPLHLNRELLISQYGIYSRL